MDAGFHLKVIENAEEKAAAAAQRSERGMARKTIREGVLKDWGGA